MHYKLPESASRQIGERNGSCKPPAITVSTDSTDEERTSTNVCYDSSQIIVAISNGPEKVRN